MRPSGYDAAAVVMPCKRSEPDRARRTGAISENAIERNNRGEQRVRRPADMVWMGLVDSRKSS